MNPKLFSFVLCVIYCIGFVCGAPVQIKNETDAVKTIPTNVPAPAVTTLPPSTKDLNPQNKTGDIKNGKVISDKMESHNGETSSTSSETVFKRLNATTYYSNVNITTNSISNETRDDKTSTTAATPTKAAPPAEVTTAKPPTTMTISSTSTHTVTISPMSNVEEKEKDRGFDGPSFIGGIILALGLSGIGFVAYKFCKARTDRNYRNL